MCVMHKHANQNLSTWNTNDVNSLSLLIGVPLGRLIQSNKLPSGKNYKYLKYDRACT